MAINKTMKKVLKALSYPEFDLKTSRKLANVKAWDPKKYLYKTIEYKVFHDGYEVPMRIYIPDIQVADGKNMERNTYPVLLFFHGGGFVTESIETYNRVCWNLAKSTQHVVVSVDYRLAPEYRFPIGLEDCYSVAKAVFQEKTILNVDPERITLIGDSAGGNITAALCLMARDRGDFKPLRQILIYPCVDNDYSQQSKYQSVRENGTDYLLTRKNMEEYMQLYKSNDRDFSNPYFSPIKEKNFSNLPKTLLITAEFDPLRDEGEAYGNKLLEAGNEVEMHRIGDALHGYFALTTKYFHVEETLDYINKFLSEVKTSDSREKDKVEEVGECCENLSSN